MTSNTAIAPLDLYNDGSVVTPTNLDVLTSASIIDRSSDTSLLDTCEDDDDDDATSIHACASEDYSPYVNETGQYQPVTNVDTTCATNQELPMTSATTAMTKTHHVSSNTEVPIPQHGVKENDASTTRVNQIKQQTGKVENRELSEPKSPRLNGLVFDLNQPWERSLLRQLDESTPTSPTSAADITNDSDPRFLNNRCSLNDGVKQNLPLSTRDQRKATQTSGFPKNGVMMVLGHTESRDFAVEYDPNENGDTISLETNSISSRYHQHQNIYRSPYMIQPRVVYHVQNQSSVEYYHNHPSSPPVDTTIITSTSSLTSYTNVLPTTLVEDGRDDEYHSKQHLPIQYNKMTRAESHQQQTQYLEMEALPVPSNRGTNVINDLYDDHNHPDMLISTSQYDPACFCLGINMLEYVLQPSSSPPTKPRPSFSTNATADRKQFRGTGILRPRRLPPLDEIDHSPPEGVDTSIYKNDAIPEVIKISSPRTNSYTKKEFGAATASIATNGTKRTTTSMEPEGSYYTTYENYYTTADTEMYNSRAVTRRQGVDI